jgi:transcriptional regulator GlxA family with amidase domain
VYRQGNVRPAPAGCTHPGLPAVRTGAAVRPSPGRLPRRPVAIRAQVVAFDGVDPLDAVSAYEVLRAGGRVSGGALTVALVSSGDATRTAGSGGVALRLTGSLDTDHADVVVLPGVAGLADETGGEPAAVPPPLTRILATELPVLLKQALDSPGVTVAAVGSGALVLAAAGLIDGRHIVTDRLGQGPRYGTAVAVPARMVDDGDLVTAGGITAGIDLALYLLERELGPRISHAVERVLAYERRGAVWRHEGAGPVP